MHLFLVNKIMIHIKVLFHTVTSFQHLIYRDDAAAILYVSTKLFFAIESNLALH